MKKTAICCLLGLLVISSTTFAQSPPSSSNLYKFSLIPERIPESTSFARSNLNFSLLSDEKLSKTKQVIPKKKKDPIFTGLIVANIITETLDIHSTYRFLKRGYKEGNPFWAPIIHNKPLTIALTVAKVAITVYLFSELKKRGKFWRYTTYVLYACGIIYQGYIVYHNYKLK